MIGIIGHFGIKNNKLDGQTIKTNLLKDAISTYGVEDIVYFDTSILINKPVYSLYKIAIIFNKCEKVIILPGIRGLKVLLPYYIMLKKIFKNKLFYVVIGGWLNDLKKKNRRIKEQLIAIDGIFAEAKDLVEELKKDYKNVYLMQNFRAFDNTINYLKLSDRKEFKCLFLARVSKLKGINLAIEAVKQSQEENSSVFLDIYGPIEPGFENELKEKLINTFNIKYKGLLDPMSDDFYKIISDYDVILFPTKYPGEGIPGTIIDGFIAGVPVIASDWKYNSSIITNLKNGIIIKDYNPQIYSQQINKLFKERNMLNALKENCYRERLKYSTEKLIGEFLEIIKKL
jgi:glycosyltransferase involved in cell wall biosynthesis